jgi:predicted ATPase/DNA-binding CsgD family transcriptional regulator
LKHSHFVFYNDLILKCHDESTACQNEPLGEDDETSMQEFRIEPTPLIGRERELVAIRQMLHREDVRLLTLIGPGGVGKTRLALQAVQEQKEFFADGAFVILLAQISDSEQVLPAIAHTLALREVADQPVLERLVQGLKERQVLLLLDNFEQMVSAASSLAELLVHCSGLKLLVTSREALHLRAEHEFAVAPLEIPNISHLPDLTTLSHNESVMLFLERAQAVKADFRLTPANAAVVAEICARLDGLPLALELAAARIKLLPPRALLARLSQRLQVLTGGARDLAPHQQTLRATLAWSYNLLSVWEKRLFRWLSIFEHGWTLEAAEAVCSALPSDESAGAMLEGIASLLDKSLLRQGSGDDEEPRYVMLEIVRDYGLECLVACGEMETVRQAHAHYYLVLAEQAEQELAAGLQQEMYLARLKWEHDNLRAAMRYVLEQAEAGRSREMALRLGGALLPFWIMQGYWSEGRTLLRQALTMREGTAVSTQAKALAAAGKLAFQQGDYDQAEKLAEESLGLFREIGDMKGSATALEIPALVAWNKGNPNRAYALLQEALALYKQTNDKQGMLNPLSALAWLARSQGEYARAQVLCEESLTLSRDLGDMRRVADAQLLMAQLLFDTQAASTTVRSKIEDVLLLYRQVDDKEGIAACFHLLGQITLLQNETEEARSWFEQSVALHKELGHQAGLSWAVLGLARVALAEHDYVAARNHYEESLARARAIDDQELLISSVEGLAMVVSARGEPVWAARLWGAAEVLRETIGEPLAPVEHASYAQAIMDARRRLGERTFTAVWAEGRTMTPEQALQAQVPLTALPLSPSTPTAGRMPIVYPAGLTAREVEVLRLVAKGMTDAQIAETLVISPRTVNTHLTSIYGKIGVSSRSEATRYALEQHLV